MLLTPGVGDDSAITVAEDGRAVFDSSPPGSVLAALGRLGALICQPDSRAHIHELAVRHRSLKRPREAYAVLLPARG